MSIDYAQRTLHSLESTLNIKKGAALQEARYEGKDEKKMQFNDKMMTQYGIALHIVGKNLLDLGYYKESKHFITKAHYVVTKMLVKERKADLQLAIQKDMKTVLEKTRYVNEMKADKLLATKGASLREQQTDNKELTDEQIERSLSAIKSGLATISNGADSVQERYAEIEDEIAQLDGAQGGEDLAKEFKEEFKDIAKRDDAVRTDEQLEDESPKVKDQQTKKPSEYDPDRDEPDQQEATAARQKVKK